MSWRKSNPRAAEICVTRKSGFLRTRTPTLGSFRMWCANQAATPHLDAYVCTPCLFSFSRGLVPLEEASPEPPPLHSRLLSSSGPNAFHMAVCPAPPWKRQRLWIGSFPLPLSSRTMRLYLPHAALQRETTGVTKSQPSPPPQPL